MTHPLARVPWTVPLCAAALTLVGLAAIGRGDELAGVLPGETGFADKQRVWAALAAVTFAGAAATPVRLWRAAAWPLFCGAIGLLLAVYAFPARNGSRRWIPLGPVLFQPSEFAKLAYVLATAAYLAHRRSHRTVLGLARPFLLAAVPVALILKEPDLGTALVFFPVLGCVLVASGAKLSHLAAAGALGVACLPVLWCGMNAEQRSRVTAVFTQKPLHELGDPAPRGDGYHLHRSKAVIALGGTAGGAGWFGDQPEPPDDPAAYRLPAARTDFVFCLVAERFGVAGTLGVLLCYGLLTAGCLRVSAGCGEPFGRLAAAGVAGLFGSQALINTAMTVGLTPVTGLALPLMSYGGSSLLFSGACLGLVVAVALADRVEVGPDPLHFGGRLGR